MHTKALSRERGAICSLTSSTNHSKLPSIAVTGGPARDGKDAFRDAVSRIHTPAVRRPAKT